MKRTNLKMKALSIMLSLCMVLQYVPTTAFAAATDNLCEHHTAHSQEVCGYVEAVAGSDCAHACPEGNCGYVAAVEAHECHYECAECVAALTADETTELSAEATESAPVCTCGTDDSAIHATTCPVYVRPENPECKCVEKCTEANVWCDVCGFDISKCGGTDEAAAYAETVTIYFKNTQGWTTVNAYYWGGTSTVNWPGTAMTHVENDIWSIDVPADAVNIIFNNSSTQTDDLAIPTNGDNLYTYNTGAWSVYDGNSGGDEGAEDDKAVITGLSIIIDDVEYNSSNTSAENPAVITPDTRSIILTAHGTNLQNGTEDNCVMYMDGYAESFNSNLWKPSGDGTTATYDVSGDLYTFKSCTTAFEIRFTNVGQPFWSNSGVYVIYDASTAEEDNTSVYTVAGSAELCGSFWDPSDSNNVMTDNGDGTFSKTFENVAVSDNYQLKVVETDETEQQWWHGTSTGDNVFFCVSAVCDVTVTIDAITKEITVTGDGVENVDFQVDSVIAVGNGDGNWLNGANWDPADLNNQMAEVSPDVYEIVYKEVEAWDGYQLKFAANQSWADNWGGTYAGSGVETNAVHSVAVITFAVPYELATVTLRLDLSGYDPSTKLGATFTITVTEETEGGEEEDAVASVTINGETSYHETLNEAIQAVKNCTAADNATVTLLKSLDVGDQQTITGGTFTLNLNSFELTGYHYGLCITGGDVTISDSEGGGTITATEAHSNGVYSNTGSLTITGGSISGYKGVFVADNTVTISGGSISGKSAGMAVNGSHVTITGGEISGNGFGVEANVGSTVEISGGSISGGYDGVRSYNGTVSISGGTLNGDIYDFYLIGTSDVLTLSEGATFPGGLAVEGTTLKAILGDGAAYWQNGKQITITDDQTEITGGDVIVMAAGETGGEEENAVASVTIGGNTTYYETLDEAIQAVKNCTEADNATVQLLKSVDVGNQQTITSGVFTLDLNGKTLSSDSYTLSVRNSGTVVTLTDSSTGGTVTTTESATAAVSVRYNSKVVIDGGSYTGDCAVRVDNGILEINDGIFTCIPNSAYVVDVGPISNVTIKGGTFSGGGWASIASEDSIIITGGTFEAGMRGHIAYWGGSFDLSNYAVDGLTLSQWTNADLTVSDDTIKLPEGYTFKDSDGNDITTLTYGTVYTIGEVGAGGEDDKAVITGLSITIDGVEYNSTNTSAENPAVITQNTQSIILTAYGTNLQNGTQDNVVAYAFGYGVDVAEGYGWTFYDGYATNTIHVAKFVNSSNYEIKYYNNYLDVDNRTEVGTGIYLTYYDDTVDTTLTVGDNAIKAGYTYTYTAEQDGTLYVTILELYFATHGIVNEVNLNDWVAVTINGTAVTKFANTVEVSAGDVVTVAMESLDGDIYHGTVNLTLEPDSGDEEENAVASVTINGETSEYPTLNEAIQAVQNCTAEDGATVKLLKSVDVGSQLNIASGVFTLDLNSNTLTGSDGGLYITGGDVTVTDTGKDGGIESTGFAGVYADGGTLNITGGNVSGDYGVYADGSTVTITGGNVSGTTFGVCVDGSTVTISGGNVSGSYGVYADESTVTITGGNVSGSTFGVCFYGSTVTISGGTVMSFFCVYADGSTVTITGGSISGTGHDLYLDSGTITLTLGENGAGATFPDDLSVTGTTLKDVLGEGAAYWQNGEQVSITDTRTYITGGDVVIKKTCDHSGNTNETYADNGDGTHSLTCSVCGTTVTEDHSTAAEGDRPVATCTAKAYCSVCDSEYGEILSHQMDPTTGLCGNGCGTQLAVASVTKAVTGGIAGIDTTTYYETLDEAIQAVSSGTAGDNAEVKLLDHLTLTETIYVSGGVFTLNLNEKDMTFSEGTSFGFDISGGEVTFAGNGTVTMVEGSVLQVWQNAVVSITGGTYDAAMALFNSATVTVSGGNLKGYVCGIRNLGDLTIRGGEVSSYQKNTNNPYDVAAIMSLGGSITVTGGTLKEGRLGMITFNDGTIDLSRFSGAEGVTIWCDDAPTTAMDASDVTLPEGYGLFDENGTQQTGSIALGTKLTVRMPHTHSWTYTASGNTITATCEGTIGNCPEPEQSFTLNAPDAVYSGEMVNAEVTREGMDLTFELHYTGTNYDSADAPINAGTYTVTMTVGDKSVSDTFTISPKNIANCDVSLGESSFTYSGKAPALSVSVVDNGVGSTLLTENTDYTVGTVAVNAGSYKLTVTGKGNYTGTVELDYTINAKEVSITDTEIQAVTYDPNGYTLTVTGVTFSGVVEGENLAYTATAELKGYNGVGTQGTEVTVTLSNSNYVLKEETVLGEVTINKAASSVTAAPAAKILTYTEKAQNLINAGSANGGEMQYSTDNQTWSATIPQATNAGTYTVYYKVVGDENHSNSDVKSVEVTIAKAKATITVNTTTINVTYGETVTLPTATTNFGTVTCDKTAADLVNAGTYTVTYTVAGDDNYEGDTKSITVTINAKAITVTADAVSKTYGDADPELTYKVEGLVSGDELTGELKRVAGENVGSYAIEQNTLTAGSNYTITFTGADLTISKRDVTVTAKDQTITYGETISGTEFTSAGLLEGHSVTVTLTPSTANVTVSGTITASAAVITADGADVTDNYNVSYTSGKLVIEPDTSKIDGLTPENVTSANEENIKAVQEMMENADSLKEEWENIVEVCEELLDRIEEVEAKQKELTDAAAGFDGDTVNSADLEDLENLAEDIRELLETENLTEEERAALEDVLEQVEDMIGTIEDTITDIKDATDTIEALDPATVTSDDKDDLEQAIAIIDELLQGDHLTEDERKALEDAKAEAEELLDVIEAAQDAANTENTEKVEGVTADNVKPEDKEALEDAKADLEKALEDYAGNYTEEEKKAIQDEIQRIDDAIEALENVEDVADAITQLPETVEPDDEEATEKILDAKKSYDELTDHEKSLVDETTKKKLDDLVAALTAYDIIKGDGDKWTKGSSSGLSFTANGPFSKFVGVEVDGKEVDAKYYDAKAGSTIITLKASYLETLSVGERTIAVVYTDGEAEGTFKINAKSDTPATGDDFNIMLYGTMFTMSIVALVVLLIASKKRKQAS